MSIIFMATSLSAVGASVLTVGALALRERMASRAKTKDEAPSPIQAFAAEHAALAGVSHNSVISDTSDTFRWNTVRLDDPNAALSEISALQTRLTTAGSIGSDRYNSSIALSGGKSDDA